ncbi:MAG: TolC family protein [Deltaproteobacteria bacterium]|nr:TolC family protein [Deltaproteobacteria bacterium]
MNSRMNNLLIALITTLLLTASMWFPDTLSASKLPIVRIAIVIDGPPARLPDRIGPGKQEILRVTEGQFDVRFPAEMTVHGNWSYAQVKEAINSLLADPKVDLIIAGGYMASNYLGQMKNLPKPVIAAVLLDRELQRFPLKDGGSGVKNLSYIDTFISVSRDIKVFHEMVPFHNLAVLGSDLAFEAIPWLEKRFREIANEYTINLTVVKVDRSADEALAALPPETDAVYVMPLAKLSPGEFRKLVYGLILRRLPSFSSLGREDVEAGLLASARPKSDIQRLTRRIALNVQRILLGEKASALKVAFPLGEKLTINMATGRAIGFYPSWSTLTEAELLNEQVERVERRLSLQSAVREAIAANLDLAAQNRNVAAGEQVVNQARSSLLPQVDLDAQGAMIDDDRAESSRGLTPERSLTGSVTATQLLYDEDSWSNFSVEKRLQTSREEQRNTVELDIIRNAAVAYLDVLRAKTLERVEKDNLRLTRANLERALVRVSVGIANRSEEFRWRSEIARNRANVLFAQARTRRTENRLNRLLNRPLEEQFATIETDLRDPLLIVSDPRLLPYVDNPRNFRIYRDYVVEEGLLVAPELLGFDAAIGAQERILVNAKRAFWLPSFAAQGTVSEVLAESGEGKRSSSESDLDDTDWSVGVFATFPLVEGGGKFATIKRAREELSRLQLERQATAERIDQRVRSALHQASASYPNINLSRSAAEAARKNLELVTDQYVRGLVSIVDLLDAQNSSLRADQAAENAVFDFLIDWMDVERAAGRFDFLMTQAEREEWFQRLQEFFSKSGVEPIRR